MIDPHIAERLIQLEASNKLLGKQVDQLLLDMLQVKEQLDALKKPE